MPCFFEVMHCGKILQVYDELRLLDSDDEEAKVGNWQTRRCKKIKVSYTYIQSVLPCADRKSEC